MVQLNPDADEIGGLLVGMSRPPWPTTDADRRRYFDRFGLYDAETIALRGDDPDTRSWRVATSLPGDIWGISTMFRNEFLGVTFFCYNESGDDGPQAKTGFSYVDRYLCRALGDPAERWGSAREPAALWHIGPLQLDMYCFQRDASGIMVGLAHTARSAANDAAHKSDPPV